MESINGTIKEQIIHTHFPTYIYFNDNELFYDNSNLFSGLNNTEIFNQIQDYIKGYSTSESKNIIFKGESDFVYQITTTEKEKELITENMANQNYSLSIIDFSECEQLLKKEYNIPENISLIILKMEKMTDKTSEKNIQYQIYEPFNMTLLNMSICEDTDITVYIPFILEGEDLELYKDLLESGYNIFNKNDKFYTDICIPFTSDEGTDIPLSARQKYIYEQYSNLCQENCQLLDYSPDTKLVSCSCKTNDEGIEPINENKFNPKTIYKSFYDILKYSNYKVLKCYELVFKKQTFLYNKGSIIVLVYFALYISFFILFIIKGLSSLKILCSKFQGIQSVNSNELKSRDNIMDNINEKNIIIKKNIKKEEKVK